MPKKSCECYVKNKLKKPTLTCNGTLVRQFDYNKFKDKIQTPPLSETKTEINNYEIDDIVCAIDSGASLLKVICTFNNKPHSDSAALIFYLKNNFSS